MKTKRTHRPDALAALVLTVSFLPTLSASAQTPDSIRQVKKASGAIQASVLGTLLPAAAGTFFILDGARGSGAKTGEVALGIGIGALGVILGPSFGHAYADHPRPLRRAWTRFAGVAIGGLGLAGMGMSNSFGNGPTPMAYAFMGVGGMLFLYGTIADFATVASSVKTYNERHGFSKIRLEPVYFSQHRAPGVAVSIDF
jgi:hypothetical protein